MVSKLGPKDSRILVVGAGNSDMSKRLFDAGYTNLVNIDIAESPGSAQLVLVHTSLTALFCLLAMVTMMYYHRDQVFQTTLY